MAFGNLRYVRRPLYLLAAPSIFALFLTFVFPLYNLIEKNFNRSDDSFSVFFFSNPFLRHILVFTYTQALASSALAGILGISSAFLVVENRFRGSHLFWNLSLSSFSLPSIVAVTAYLGFWGRSGWLQSIFAFVGITTELPFYSGWFPILCCHAFLNYPIYLKLVGTALLELDREAEKTALSLGASRWHCFWFFTLSKLMPSIRSAFFISFLYCSMSFLIVLLLGGGPRFTTIEVAIFQAVKVDLDIPTAARLALLQLTLSTLLYFACSSQSPPPVEKNQAPFTPLYAIRSPVIIGPYVILLAVCVLGPVCFLILEGVKAATLSPARLIRPAATSLILAILVSLFSMALAFPLARLRRHTQSLLIKGTVIAVCSLPMAVSGILLTLSWMLAYPQFYWNARGSLCVVGLLQSVLVLPLTMRTIDEGFARISDDVYATAQTLGAHACKTMFLVEFPLLRPYLVSAGLFAFAFSMGEIGIVLLLLSENISTLPLWMYYRIGQYQFDQADQAALLLLLISAISYGVASWFYPTGNREGVVFEPHDS